ncbi:hypothetical protein C817_05298 [Dorea sp. 5-2]|nr:hypothetical protein C817_05298 [Dorea sp. 5-2]
MNERKNMTVLIGFVLSISLIASTFTVFFLINSYGQVHMQTLGEIFQRIIEKQPEAENIILETLKEYKSNPEISSDTNILLLHGYKQTDLFPASKAYSSLFILAGFGIGCILFIITLIFWHRKDILRIKFLTTYLEKVNNGDSDILFQVGEDDLSKLQDEIYKTVTMLSQTRNMALRAKNNFAENLYNIAHQIKTPITSISLSVQIMRENPSSKYLDQIQGRLSQLTHLEETLLLLSRIDAGTLPLEKKAVDLYTVLMLAADNLQDLLAKSNVSVDIPELGEITIQADLDWTMEAIINLLKNCMEHTPPGGVIHCSYEQNPIYTQIKIWDTGAGFAKEDLPHLFERFYRGQNAIHSGIGIGLSLSKAIIESQNGTISAKNLVDGGACYEIRFYSH